MNHLQNIIDGLKEKQEELRELGSHVYLMSSDNDVIWSEIEKLSGTIQELEALHFYMKSRTISD